jgi:hypothetical protein
LDKFCVGPFPDSCGFLRQTCNQIIRHITRKLSGVGGASIRIFAACDDKFWDAFPEVRQT